MVISEYFNSLTAWGRSNTIWVGGIVLVFAMIVSSIARFLVKQHDDDSFKRQSLRLLAIPAQAVALLTSLVTAFIHFVLSVFELGREPTNDQFKFGAAERRDRDVKRALHFAWHSVVFFPVLVICVMAYMLGSDPRKVLLFGALASSTVALEICIGIILDKAAHLEDLSRQTRRVYTTISDAQEIANWIEYMHHRHAAGREGLAKAALVTTFSLVLFSCIVGIEVIELNSSHGNSGNDHRTSQTHSSNSDPAPKPDDEAFFPAWKFLSLVVGKPVDRELKFFTMAMFFSGCLIVISLLKLWIQTRHCLEETDPMDRFESGEQALLSWETSTTPTSHLTEDSSAFKKRLNQENPDDVD